MLCGAKTSCISVTVAHSIHCVGFGVTEHVVTFYSLKNVSYPSTDSIVLILFNLFIICLFMWNSVSVNRTRCVCSDLDVLVTFCLGSTDLETLIHRPVLRMWALYDFQKSNNKDVLYWEKHNHQTELKKCDLTISKEETRAYLRRSDEIYIVLNIDANTRANYKNNCSTVFWFKNIHTYNTNWVQNIFQQSWCGFARASLISNLHKERKTNILKYIIDALCGGEAAVTLYNKHFSVSSTSLALWNLKCSHDLTLIKLLLQW